MNLLTTERFTAPRLPVIHSAAAVLDSVQVCPRCNGGGKFLGRRGQPIGDCFACKGAGRVSVKPTAPKGVEVSDEALRATFDKLRESGLSRVKLHMQGFLVKPAKASGKNPGALYVTQGSGGTYLGKIINGRFDSTSDCDVQTAAKVAALIADPMAAIKATGQEVGSCAVCGLELTDPTSLAYGIGPTCRERLGC